MNYNKLKKAFDDGRTVLFYNNDDPNEMVTVKGIDTSNECDLITTIQGFKVNSEFWTWASEDMARECILEWGKFCEKKV